MGKGRPSIYSKELEDSIIDLIESGLSERKIAQMDGMPSIRTIHRWKDEKPEFCLRAKHARAASADIYNDRRMENRTSSTRRRCIVSRRENLSRRGLWRQSARRCKRMLGKRRSATTPATAIESVWR